MTEAENNKCILISSVSGKCYCTDGKTSHDRSEAKIFDSREDAEKFIKENDFYALDIVQLTFDIYFNDNENSNNEGFFATFDYCKNYIKNGIKGKSGYFADYLKGTVSIVCNETEQTIENSPITPKEFLIETINGKYLSQVYMMTGRDFETLYQEDAHVFESKEEAERYIICSGLDTTYTFVVEKETNQTCE